MSDTTIQAKIQIDMAAAMKARDAETLSTLRMLKAALLEAKTKKPKDEMLSGDEEIEVLQRYARKRRETLEEMKKLGRDDLAGKEQREIDVTLRYLPQPMGEDEIRSFVREAVQASGAAGPKDMGRVMGLVMAKVKGRADGSVVSRLVKDALQG